MSEKESQGQASASAKNPEEGSLESIKGELGEIKGYLETVSKTEKDAAALQARLNLTGEERELTPEEKGYKKNLEEDRKQALIGLKAVEGDLRKIEAALASISGEGDRGKELKECRKQAAKYLNEVEEQLRKVAGEENAFYE